MLLRRQDARIWRISLRAFAFPSVEAETIYTKTEGVDISVWNMGVGRVHIRTRVVVRRTRMPLSAGKSQDFKVLLEPKEVLRKRKIVCNLC